MKLFKRGFAMLLACLMLVMAVPFGGMAVYAAENYPTIELGVTTQAVIDEEYAYFWFTPVESGWYQFYSMADRNTYGYVYDADGYTLASDDDNGENNNFRVLYSFEAGVTYRLGARFYSDDTGTFDVCIEKYFPHYISDVVFQDITIASYELADYGDYPNPRMDVYYADGVSEVREGYYLYDDGYSYNVSVTYNVPFEDWLAGGAYVATAEITGGETTIYGSYVVTVEESPILYVEVEGPQHIVNCDGWSTYDNYYNEETDTYERTPEYRYYPTEPERVVIHLKDGSAWENGYVNWNGRDYWINYNVPRQSYENQWGVGNHTVQGTIMGYDFSYDVEIVESPIASIEYQPVTLVEESGGYWRTDSYWDDELQQYVDREYYHYYPNIYATVTMKDGTVYEDVSWFDWNGHGPSVQGDWQQVEQPLQFGMNYIQTRVLGYDTVIPIEVIDTPIANIEFNPVIAMEYSNGYWDEGTYWDDELQQDVPYRYYYYHVYPRATVTMKDGTVYEDVSGFEWGNRWYSFNNFEQSWNNPLQLGVNYVTSSICGYDYTLAIEVQESPIAEVIVPERTLIENYNGYWASGWYYDEEGNEHQGEYFEYWNYGPQHATIILKDGTIYEDCSGFYWNDQWQGLSYSGQSYENRILPGRNERWFRIMGYEGTYVVNVVEPPIASIEVGAPIALAENQQGYWNSSSYWDEDLQEDVYIEFFYYYDSVVTPSLTVTLKDGTVYENCTGFHWNNQWYGMSIQSQYNGDYLRPGRNVRTGSIMGYEFEYEVMINTMHSNDSYEYMESEDYVIITDCYITDETVEIPAEINGKPVIGVTGLNSAWYTLNHLILPDSVVTIGEYLLNQLDNLQSVHFGAGVSNLTAEMFGYCWGLQSITVSEDNPYYCVVNNALHNKALDTFIAYPTANESLDYVVPATVVNIEALDWYGVYNRVNVIFPADHIAFVTVDGVTYNKEMTLVVSCNKNKTGDYVMPDTVEEIAPSAFMYSDLTSVVVSPKVTEIVYCAFASCANLESVTLPMGLVSIEQSAFESTESLKNIDLPDTLEYIGTHSFYQSGLTALSVPDSVTTIDNNAFYCSQIQTLELGDGLQTIGDFAFAETPVSSVSFGSGLTKIGYEAFADTENLLEIAIPGNVEWIDEYAFTKSGLASVTLGDGVGFISNRAFSHCNNLTAMHFPASVYYISSTAFNSCNSLTTLTVDEANKYYFSNGNCIITHDGILQVGCNGSVIPNDGSVQCIEGYAFYDMDGLQSIQLPDSLEIIGESAFGDCDGITSVVIPDSVKTIDVYAFSGCGNLTEAVIGDGVEFVGAVAFAGCPLQSVDLGNSLTFIAPTVFSGTALSTVFIPDSVTSIMYWSFENCQNLTSIELPISVTTIEWEAFYNCYNLTDVYYQGTEADRENIYIEWGNEYLENATWHYGWVSDKWAELPTCDHVYDGVCDSDCNLCGARRKAPHAYANACAEWCSLCKEWREVGDHIYDNACDDTCNECGAMRAVTAHVYDNACDAICNECGAIREVGDHWYDNACDVDCNECGAIRVAADHIYDDKYDADCNECGAVREALSPVLLTVENVTARLDDTFEVAVRIDNNTGLAGLRFDVVYDEALFELVGYVAGDDFATASFGPVQSPFNMLWYDFLSDNNTANGVLLTLTFRVKADAALGTSIIEVVPYAEDFVDNQFESVRCETVSGTITVVETTPGDANGDGVVSVIDLGYLQRLITGWDVDVDADALDVNKDGKLNNRDIALLQRYLNGWDVTLQ